MFLSDVDKAPSPNFKISRQKELTGLLDNGVLKVVHKKDIPPSARIFGSRFVDVIKNEGTEKAYEKSRLVVQAYNDNDNKKILTQSPTIQRSSQQLILCLSQILQDVNIYLRDISQAYTQSTSSLARSFFIKAPDELNLPDGFYLKVLMPLYGIPEAGTHWFGTYHKHHIDKLKLTPSTFDSCLLYNNSRSAIVGLQTDDSLIVAIPEFMVTEEYELEKAHILSKPIEKLTDDHPIEFNGSRIAMIKGGLAITQKKQIKKIQLLEKTFTKEDDVQQCARGAYIATVSQPQAAFALSYAAQITEPTSDDADFLNRCLLWQTLGKGLNFVELDSSTLRLLAFTDSSFANNRDLTSQIGYVIVLADAKNIANIIHWQSVKCRRVTRSVLASELYALSLGFDIAATKKSTINQIFSHSTLDNKIPLNVCVDSKSLFDCLVKLGTTQEKRLMIDLHYLRQSYERREVTEILWIDGNKTLPTV